MEEDENSVMDTDEDDDPVIKEIPIILSKRLEDQVYIFQYPNRPSASKSLAIKKCFVKPKSRQAKLEVELNPASSNFNTARAEDIAFAVDGMIDPMTRSDDDKEVVFESGMMDKVTYVSSQVVENTDCFAVGAYNGKEYHISPLKGFLRMKPHFPHLDRDNKRKRDSAKQEDGSDEDELPATKAQQVTVRFANRGGDSERWAKAKEASFRTLMAMDAQEPWVECDWHGKSSELSDLEKAKFFSENTSRSLSNTMESGKEEQTLDYLRTLVPEDQEQAIITPSLPSNVVSLSSLRALPLIDQCKMLLKDAKLISFPQLSMLLAGCEGVTLELTLKALPQLAVLVRGNWAVKSEVLFPKDTLSAVSGVPAEVMCRARDYVLLLFTRNQYVERRKVSSVIKIPTEEIKEIFTGISKLRYSKGWELALPTDTDFINKYTDIVQRQNALWDQREAQLNLFFKENTSSNDRRQRRKSKSISEEAAAKSKTEETKVATRKEGKDGGFSSDTDSGTEKKDKSGRKRKNSKTVVSNTPSKNEVANCRNEAPS